MRSTIAIPAALVALVVAALLFYSSTFVVTERDQAIKLRFGEIQDVITEPGLYFKWPTNLIDRVQIIDKRLLTLELADRTVQVSDGRRYVVDAYATYEIGNPQRFREAVSGNVALASERLRTRLDAALRQVYGLRTFDAALSEARVDMMRELRELIRPDASELGIDIVDVRILRTDLVAEVSQQTYDRMRAERLAEAAQLRAAGNQDALTIRAQADRDVTVILAEAQRDGEVLRGQGDAERTRILADAYGQDPDFFQFFRSMQAYRTAMQGTNTTMLVSPDSTFFRFFEDPEGVSIAGTTPERPDSVVLLPEGADETDAGLVTPLPEETLPAAGGADTVAPAADGTPAASESPAAAPAAAVVLDPDAAPAGP